MDTKLVEHTDNAWTTDLIKTYNKGYDGKGDPKAYVDKGLRQKVFQVTNLPQNTLE